MLKEKLEQVKSAEDKAAQMIKTAQEKAVEIEKEANVLAQEREKLAANEVGKTIAKMTQVAEAQIAAETAKLHDISRERINEIKNQSASKVDAVVNEVINYVTKGLVD